MNPLFVFDGLELLSEDQQRGLWDMLQGAINVMVKHKDDPGLGDVGWRKQTIEEQLEHAYYHVLTPSCAHEGNEVIVSSFLCDDDGLPHVDHATARIALYYAKRNLLKKDGE